MAWMLTKSSAAQANQLLDIYTVNVYYENCPTAPEARQGNLAQHLQMLDSRSTGSPKPSNFMIEHEGL